MGLLTDLLGDGGGGGAAPIAETVLSASAASITFSDIPQTYRHLQIVVQGVSDGTGAIHSLNLRFNGDTAANYEWQYVDGAATALNGNRSTAASAIDAGLVDGPSATNPGSSSDISIANYRGTTFRKSVTSRAMSAEPRLRTGGGIWNSTAAITSVTLLPSTGSFIAGTVATLYGRMGA